MRLETTDLITISAFVELLNEGTTIADVNNWYNRSIKLLSDHPELKDTWIKINGRWHGLSRDPVREVFFVRISNVKFIHLLQTNLQKARK